ncbi:MAG: ParB/RepB/Spo0J family partition protein [Myxococcota bacterium]|nr:ParB/RepB/Spo0J family partition protein [Myxococcota bacterium]MDW8361204.1 ParB/RepB/Spo0J family partition protein [Myxococcales bacterium]
MSSPESRRPRLGRGLDAILPVPAGSSGHGGSGGALELPIEELHPNRAQPRRRFDEAALDELAQSIRSVGVLAPIVVRRRPAGGYEIVAGERRWRAAQRAGLRAVPVVIRELTPAEALEAALVENVQREDLEPLELARAYQQMIESHGYTQERLAARVGRDRSTIANALRLLRLPPEVLALLEERRIDEGHARALLQAASPAEMIRLARMAAERGLSVRQVEALARASRQSERPASRAERTPSANVRDLENRLRRSLGVQVRVVDRKGRGRIELNYGSLDELDRLLARLL